jgi:hypothetical protein
MTMSDEDLTVLLQHMLSELEQQRGLLDRLVEKGVLTREEVAQVTRDYHARHRERRAGRSAPWPQVLAPEGDANGQ